MNQDSIDWARSEVYSERAVGSRRGDDAMTLEDFCLATVIVAALAVLVAFGPMVLGLCAG